MGHHDDTACQRDPNIRVAFVYHQTGLGVEAAPHREGLGEPEQASMSFAWHQDARLHRPHHGKETLIVRCTAESTQFERLARTTSIPRLPGA